MVLSLLSLGLVVALKLVEGFEIRQGVGWLTDEYSSVSLTGVSFGLGRLLGAWQGTCLVHQSTTAGYLRTGVLTADNRWYGGLWFDASYSAENVDLIEFREGGANVFRVRLHRRSSLTFRFEFLEGGTVRANSVDLPYASSNGYYVSFELELDVTGNLSRSLLYYRVDGELHLAYSVLFVMSGSTLPVEIGFGFGSGSATETFKLDDIYVLDGTGLTNNSLTTREFFVEGLLPDVNGAYQQWSGILSGAPDADHASLLDDPANASNHDVDSSYIVTDVTGEIDVEAFGSLAYISDNIIGAMITTNARIEDPGTRDVEIVYRDSTGVLASVGVHTTSSTVYSSESLVMETNPLTGATWTAAKINSAQFGVRLLAS